LADTLANYDKIDEAVQRIKIAKEKEGNKKDEPMVKESDLKQSPLNLSV